MVYCLSNRYSVGVKDEEELYILYTAFVLVASYSALKPFCRTIAIKRRHKPKEVILIFGLIFRLSLVENNYVIGKGMAYQATCL